VATRVKQIKNLVANTEQEYEKEKLNERIARLSGGVAIIQVRGGTLALPPALWLGIVDWVLILTARKRRWPQRQACRHSLGGCGDYCCPNVDVAAMWWHAQPHVWAP
jgi:hypothetical protein